MENAIVIGARTFAALRKSGKLMVGRQAYHAVAPQCRPALCSAEPGPASWWAEPPGELVTCAACLGRLKRMRDGLRGTMSRI